MADLAWLRKWRVYFVHKLFQLQYEFLRRGMGRERVVVEIMFRCDLSWHWKWRGYNWISCMLLLLLLVSERSIVPILDHSPLRKELGKCGYGVLTALDCGVVGG